MEPMLAWTLINRQFAKIRPTASREAEDCYYQSFAGWSGPFRRSRTR
jgi:hypothetical protein